MTLIEVMVAMAIISIVSLMVLQAFMTVARVDQKSSQTVQSDAATTGAIAAGEAPTTWDYGDMRFTAGGVGYTVEGVVSEYEQDGKSIGTFGTGTDPEQTDDPVQRALAQAKKSEKALREMLKMQQALGLDPVMPVAAVDLAEGGGTAVGTGAYLQLDTRVLSGGVAVVTDSGAAAAPEADAARYARITPANANSFAGNFVSLGLTEFSNRTGWALADADARQVLASSALIISGAQLPTGSQGAVYSGIPAGFVPESVGSVYRTDPWDHKADGDDYLVTHGFDGISGAPSPGWHVYTRVAFTKNADGSQTSTWELAYEEK